MDKYRPCPSIIAMFTSDSQHPPRSKHAVYLGEKKVLKSEGKWYFGGEKIRKNEALKTRESYPYSKSDSKTRSIEERCQL